MTTKRIIAGTFATYLNTGISMTSNLILVPMYLYYLGKEEYGLWIVVLSIVSYLGLSKLGISQSVANAVASANARKDYDGIRFIIATGFWLYTIIAIVISILIVVSVPITPIESFIKVSDSLNKVIAPVLLISSFFFLLQLPLIIFRITLRSLNFIYKEQLLGIMFTLAQFAGVTVVLWLRIGIIGLSIVYGAIGVLSGLIFFLYLYKIVPGISLSIKLIDRELVKQLIKPGVYFLILSLSGVLVWGTDNIIISAVLGTAAVAPYAIAFRFFMIATGIASVITSNMLPAITSNYAINNTQKLTDLYVNSLTICFGLAFLALLLLINIGPDLIIKWIGFDNYVGNPTFYVFISLVFIQIALFPADAILMGTTRHRGYAIMALFEGIINVLLSLWWIHIWGVFGVAAATLTARLATSAWFLVYRCNNFLAISLTSFIAIVFKPFLVPITGAFIAGYITGLMPLTGWNKIIVNAACINIVFMALYYSLSLSVDKRIELSRLLRGNFDASK